jgi:hypothetical protein
MRGLLECGAVLLLVIAVTRWCLDCQSLAAAFDASELEAETMSDKPLTALVACAG